MIRIQWRENGAIHASWKETATQAQKLVCELQEREINPTVKRFTDKELAELRRLGDGRDED